MQSPEVLDAVIEKLNLTALPEFASGNRGGQSTLRDWVESKLRSKVSIYPGLAGSQFLYVGASASRNDLAANIANAIVDVYVDQLNATANVSPMERAARYSEELVDLKKKVQAAQDAVTKFRTTTGAIDIDSKDDVEADLLSALEHRLLDARNALQSSQARAGERTEPTTAFLASSTVASLREEGTKLAARMAQMRTNLGPNHPEVVALQSQIEANKVALQAAMSTYSRARPPVKADHPNPIKNMAMGLGLGLALWLALPFALELPGRKIRCRDDLEGSLGIPVLAELTPMVVPAAR